MYRLRANKMLAVYNNMLRERSPERSVFYYERENIEQQNFLSQPFCNLRFSDIVKYFKTGDKESCLPPEVENYFKNIENEGERVEHTFSVYLLGIYCYDQVEKIRTSVNAFIHKIRKKLDVKQENQDIHQELRKDFLYLWYLTALYHDMGYCYEQKGTNDNSELSCICGGKNKSKKKKPTKRGILGIPKKILKSAYLYFELRRNNIFFNENLCTDHGFAGGFSLYSELKRLHEDRSNDRLLNCPFDENGLMFSPLILQWYNVPSAWAIICHNIWIAFSGTGRADKYEKLGLKDLIFHEKKSPIKLKKHPLLFLLCLTDTIDPCKRFGKENLDKICISGTENTLFFQSCCSCVTEKCSFMNRHLKKLETDLEFLVSDSFYVAFDDSAYSSITLNFR